jgi:hypothetical protein
MKDVTMCQLLSLADLGHIMSFLMQLSLKNLADFIQSWAKTQLVCSHHTNQDTVGAFHILNNDLMSDVTMCQLLSLADLGHIMSLLVLLSLKNLADFIQSWAKTQLVCSHHTNQDTVGAFHIFIGDLVIDVTMCQLLSRADLGHIMSFLVQCHKKFGWLHPELSQNPAGLQ